MAYHRLCESDYRFLSLIWDHEPVNSTELVRLAAEELGWKKSTVYTMVKKLAEKDLVANENATVRSLVPREEIRIRRAVALWTRPFPVPCPVFWSPFTAAGASLRKRRRSCRSSLTN